MRGMGDTAAYLRRGIREIICLALFYFTYLAGEYLFDVRVAEFVPPSEVVVYESFIVGASANRKLSVWLPTTSNSITN